VEEVEDERLHLERVAALDIGKAGLEACVRAPGKSNPARRAQEVRSFGTTQAEILVLAAWLHEHQVAQLDAVPGFRPGRRPGPGRRGRGGHERLRHPSPPRVVGQVLPPGEAVGRQVQGPQLEGAGQPLPGRGAR
jgi:hypothetical protein